jgi:hypothetical protein
MSGSGVISEMPEPDRTGSLTRSSNLGLSRPDMTSLRPTVWLSSILYQSAFGESAMISG